MKKHPGTFCAGLHEKLPIKFHFEAQGLSQNVAKNSAVLTEVENLTEQWFHLHMLDIRGDYNHPGSSLVIYHLISSAHLIKPLSP